MKRERGKEKRERQKAAARRFDWRRITVHAPVLAVVLIAVAAYSNSFRAPLLIDSAEAVLQDTRVHSDTPENVARILHEPYNEVTLDNHYRPLTTWSYLWNFAKLDNGRAPAGYHWTNFTLHAINIVLVYALAFLVFGDRMAALAASALWGLHPVLTAAVTNVAGRAEVLSALGVLAALLCYRGASFATGARRAVYVVGVLLAAGVAVSSNESGAIVLALLVLCDIAFLRDRPPAARGAAFAAALVAVAGFWISRAAVLSHSPAGLIAYTDNPILGASFWTARLTAFHVIARCLGLLVWPARLSADYSYNSIAVGADGAAFLGVALCVAGAALAVWAWFGRKPLFFAISFLFVCLAPVSNLFFLSGVIMDERFLYLPAVGFCLAVVYGLRSLAGRGPTARKAATAAVCVLAIAGAARGYARNLDWSDAPRLWQSVIDAAPDNYRGHIEFAATLPLDKRADRDRAVAEIRKMTAILDPVPEEKSSGLAYRMAGEIYRNMGDEIALGRADNDGTQAGAWYDKALEILFRAERMEVLRSMALMEENQRHGTPRPTFLSGAIYLQIGRTYLRMSNRMQALSFYEKGRQFESIADLLEDEAGTIASLGDFHKAAQLYIEALEVDGSRTDLGDKIVEMYTKLDPTSCAVVRNQGPPRLDVQCPLVHKDICGAAQNVENTFTRRGQMEDAAAIRRVAIIDLGCASPSGK